MLEISELKKQILLKDLSNEEIEVIRQRMEVKNFPKGQMIFKEGEPTEGIYLVNKGKVEISKSTPDGWKQTLAVLTEGHFFGELSVIEDKKHHGANAKAIDNTEVFLIKTEDFKEMENTHPKMMYKIMKTIARVSSKNVHSMNERLIRVLISY
jgi:CRP-like cAMP-binding protein